jgi:hypothetical protein
MLLGAPAPIGPDALKPDNIWGGPDTNSLDISMMHTIKKQNKKKNKTKTMPEQKETCSKKYHQWS